MIGLATAREERIKRTQALARRFASASILGRVGNRLNWNLAVCQQKRKDKHACFAVYVYRSNLHLRGYSESVDNIPHKALVAYRLNVFPKRGQPLFDAGPWTEQFPPRVGSR